MPAHFSCVVSRSQYMTAVPLQVPHGRLGAAHQFRLGTAAINNARAFWKAAAPVASPL